MAAQPAAVTAYCATLTTARSIRCPVGCSDPHLVVYVPVQLGVLIGLEDVLEHAELRFFLRLEGLGVVEHFSVAVTKDVGGVPAGEPEHAGLEGGRQDRLHHRLAGLEVLAA